MQEITSITKLLVEVWMMQLESVWTRSKTVWLSNAGRPVVDRFAVANPGNSYDFQALVFMNQILIFHSVAKTALLRFKEQEPEKAKQDEPEVLACFLEVWSCFGP